MGGWEGTGVDLFCSCWQSSKAVLGRGDWGEPVLSQILPQSALGEVGSLIDPVSDRISVVQYLIWRLIGLVQWASKV
jgi:hypothetical protein